MIINHEQYYMAEFISFGDRYTDILYLQVSVDLTYRPREILTSQFDVDEEAQDSGSLWRRVLCCFGW